MRIVIFALSALLFSCTREVVTVYYDVTALPVSAIYSSDSVSDFTRRVGTSNKEIADSYREKAKGAREKNPEKAIYFLKRSITLLPEKEKYLELADLLWKTKQVAELEGLYSVLHTSSEVKDITGNFQKEYLFGEPEEALYYEQIAAYVAENKALYSEYTWQPRELGFDMEKMAKKLQRDPRIGMDTTSQAFKHVLLQFLDTEKLEEISKRPDMFQSYVASAPDTSLVYSIGKKQLQEFSYNRYTDVYMVIDFSSIYIHYLVESREKSDTWIQFEVKHQLPVSGNFHTMIYAVDTSALASPPEFRHIYHRLVTYDTRGNIIDSKIIATQSAEDLTLADVNKNQVRLKSFKRKFQKPYVKGDYDNEVIEVTPLEEINLEITAEGKIQPPVVL